MTFEPYLYEKIISDFLWAYAKDFIKPSKNNPFDFILSTPDNRTLYVEAKSSAPNTDRMIRLVSRAKEFIGKDDEFVLLTPNEPSNSQKSNFKIIFDSNKIKGSWLTLNDLAKRLGVESPKNIFDTIYLDDLQTKAILKNAEHYKNAFMGTNIPRIKKSLPYKVTIKSKAHKEEPETQETIATNCLHLVRQFPYKFVAELSKSQRDLSDVFKFGERRGKITIVLSDLVNFSDIVSESLAEDLKDMMGNYYHQARNAVFIHNGMLDKFIGDTVLAVFGYPDNSDASAINAIKYAQELISIGNNILSEWKSQINAIIDTGTRIGIATGDIWPLNIGEKYVELTLLGDTINLAARLEKNSPHDSFLMDNRTRTLASRQDSTYVQNLHLQRWTISPEDAKGQKHSTIGWSPKPQEEKSAA